ncbi:peptide deformylase [Spiroplasma endosymbiont of Anurida maritima]|uniref:peptide deformylase n=1 Tax=Spiroplasma endosymbiont of Anurida maritima TaxID=2967972 RepID=UPI0036D32EC8
MSNKQFLGTPSKEWLVFDDQKSIREKSQDVSFPLNKEDKYIMDKLIEFVVFSQDPVLNEQSVVRPAVGLAAPQIGANINMYYIRFQEELDDGSIEITEHALINPVITGFSKQLACIEEGEGCLSVRQDHKGFVPRCQKVIIEGYDYLQEKQVKVMARNYQAIVFQHEQEHLIGKLYYDHINKKEPYKNDEYIIL